MAASRPTWTSADVQRRLRGLADRLHGSAGAHGAADPALSGAGAGFLDRIRGRGARPAPDGDVAPPVPGRGGDTRDPGPAAPPARAALLWGSSASGSASCASWPTTSATSPPAATRTFATAPRPT